MNEIINLNDYESKADVTRDVGPDWQYMGHPTPALGGLKGSALATPFALGEAATGMPELTPHDATARYRQWLWAQMRGRDPGVLEALRAIGPTTVLACWCDPTPCYCQVIARAATWLHAHEAARTRSSRAAGATRRPTSASLLTAAGR
jgi:hypothetical protein